MKLVKSLKATVILLTVAFFSPLIINAQVTTPLDSQQTIVSVKRGVIKDSTYDNVATGEFTPGRGFLLSADNTVPFIDLSWANKAEDRKSVIKRTAIANRRAFFMTVLVLV